MTTQLGNLVSVTDCAHQTAPRAAGNAYGYSIGTREVRAGRIRLEAAKPINRETYEAWTARATPQLGDLIFSREAPMGEVGEVPGHPRVCLGQRTVLLRPYAGPIDHRYLKYLLMSPQTQGWIAKNASGSTVLHLNVADVRRIPLPEPPALSEQRRIVDILEDHLSRLDAAESYLRAGSQRAATLRQSTLDWACTGGNAALRRDDALAPGWSWRTIDEVVNGRDGAVIGPFGSDLVTSDYRDSGTPLVFVRDVRNAVFDGPNRRYVDADKARGLRRHLAQRGDVLVTKMGDPPGDAAVYDQDAEAIVTADVIRLRPSSRYNPEFIAYTINSQAVKRQVEAITRGVAQRKVSLGRFRETVRVPVPALAQQTSIVSYLAEELRDVSAASNAISLASQRSAALRRALLAAAFSGRLTDRSSDLELAEELIDA